MNIISPFGRLSRRGYLAVAAPLVVVIFALTWTTHEFAPPLQGASDTLTQGPWLRWMMIVTPVFVIGEWCLFCACVKRLHDFRWSGVVAVPLLWSWLRGALVPFMAWAVAHWQVTSPDLVQIISDIDHIGFGLRLYGLALLIVLAIVPTYRRRGDPESVAAT